MFHRYAVDQGLIAPSVRANKRLIRDSIRSLPQGNDSWTRLQGLVYGSRMEEAELADGLARFLGACRDGGIGVSVISHKTVYPALGPAVNLREAAMKWIEDRVFSQGFGLSAGDIFFVGTLEEKLALIGSRGCTHFIDDLPEVLLHPGFPPGVERILYSPEGDDEGIGSLRKFSHWDEINEHFFGR